MLTALEDFVESLDGEDIKDSMDDEQVVVVREVEVHVGVNEGGQESGVKEEVFCDEGCPFVTKVPAATTPSISPSLHPALYSFCVLIPPRLYVCQPHLFVS